MNKLTAIPLGIMIVTSILGLLGMGTVGTPSTIVIGGTDTATLYYDYGGHAKCFYNGTSVSETGLIYHATHATWKNASSPPYFTLYWDTSHTREVEWEEVGQQNPSVGTTETSFNNSYTGLWAMGVGFVLLATVVGLRIFGWGVSEESIKTILMLAFYTALWLIFAGLSYPLISAMELIGAISWFVITVMYAIGILSNMGNSNTGGS